MIVTTQMVYNDKMAMLTICITNSCLGTFWVLAACVMTSDAMTAGLYDEIVQ